MAEPTATQDPAGMPALVEMIGVKYPRSLLPSTGKKRAHRQTYCQRLARNLDHFDKHPEVWNGTIYTKLPPFLKAPPEIRQLALYYVLDALTKRSNRPNSTCWAIPIVCKAFAEDYQEVCKIWQREVEEEAASKGNDRASTDRLLSEWAGPLAIHARILREQQAASRAAKKASYKSRRQQKIQTRMSASASAMEHEVQRDKKNPLKNFGVYGKTGEHKQFDD